MSSSAERLKVALVAQAVESQLSGSQKELCLGNMLVNTAAMKTVRIVNESLCNEMVSIVCENENGEVLKDVVRSSDAIIHAKTARPIPLNFAVSNPGNQVFNIYAQSAFSNDRILLCSAKGKGVYASMSVHDVASAGKSK